MKTPISLSLAIKSYFRGTKTYLILSVGMAIVVAMLMISLALNQHTLSSQAHAVRQVTGDWHLAYLFNDATTLSTVKNIEGVEQVYTCFHIPVIDETSDDNISFLAIDDAQFSDFLAIDNGVYPCDEAEIIVPNWFCIKQQITSFPHTLTIAQKEWIVTGSFECDYFQTRNNIPVYLSYDKNRMLREKGSKTLPWGSMLPNNQKFFKYEDIVLVELEDGVNLKEMISRLSGIDGIGLFPYSDLYGVGNSTTPNEGSPWINGELIGAENIKDAGRLSDEGVYGAQKRLSTIYTMIVYALSIVLVLTFLCLKRNEIIRHAGILRVMGIRSTQLVFIHINLLILVVLFAMPVGLIIGASFVHVTVGLYYLDWLRFMFGILLLICSVFLPNILYIGITIFKKPLVAIHRPLVQSSCKNITVRHSLLIGNRVVWFPFCLSLRRIRTQKSKTLYTATAVILLFSMFTICLSQISLLEAVGEGRPKYECDFRIDAESDIVGSQKEVVEKIRNIQGVQAVLCPYTYLENFGSDTSASIIAKIPREKLTIPFTQKLLESQFPHYVENDNPFIFSDSGVIGVNESELDYLKQHLIEGSLDPLYVEGSSYVLLPKYFESYQNANIEITNLKIGDTIEICASEARDISGLCNEHMRTLKIAGFVDVNPFEPTNGVSSEFSIIMNAESLSALVPSAIGRIYIKTNDEMSNNIQQVLSGIAQNQQGYRIVDAREDQFQLKMKWEAQRLHHNHVMFLLIATAFVVFLGLGDVFFVQASLRREEMKLMHVIGFSLKMLRIIDLLEALLISVLAIVVGFGFSLFCIKKINDDIMLQQLILIPWDKWVLVAIIMTGICMIMSYIAISFSNKKC